MVELHRRFYTALPILFAVSLSGNYVQKLAGSTKTSAIWVAELATAFLNGGFIVCSPVEPTDHLLP